MTDIPEKMKAVEIVKYGSPKEALVYTEDRAVPKIKKPTEVLIKVAAAGLNPAETKNIVGTMYIVSRFVMTFPSVMGADFSGVIVSKGAKVTDFEVGDQVFGSLHFPIGLEGTYAQYAILDTAKGSIAKKPANLSHENAASVGMATGTAYQCVIVDGKIDFNDTSVKHKLLVVGASGGVGSYAVQLAKVFGVETVAICSGRNAEFVKDLGADRVVDYSQAGSIDALVKEETDTYDLILDCVGGDEYYNQLSPLLKKKGAFTTIVGPVAHAGSEAVKITELVSLVAKVAYRAMFGRHYYKMNYRVPHSSFKDIAALFESGKVRATTKSIFPLENAADAHDQIMTNRTVGKIALSIPQ